MVEFLIVELIRAAIGFILILGFVLVIWKYWLKHELVGHRYVLLYKLYKLEQALKKRKLSFSDLDEFENKLDKEDKKDVLDEVDEEFNGKEIKEKKQ